MKLAVHLDLNGTLDQAEDIRQRGWYDATLPYIQERFATSVNIPSEAFHASLGLASKDVISAVRSSINAALTLYGIELTESDVQAIYNLRNERLSNDGYDERGYPLRDGAAEMIRELSSAGDMLTIVTSETIEHAQRTLSLGGVAHLFTCVVGRNFNVGNREILKKPHYEPYQVASSLIELLSGLKLFHIGAEDTAPGIESIVRAKNISYINEAVHVKGIQSVDDVTAQLSLQAVEKRTPQQWQAELLMSDASLGEFSEKLRDLRH